MTGETGPAVITVVRTGDTSEPVTVLYSTADGTARAGDDYTPFSGATLSFAAGETAKSFSIPIINDLEIEPNETFQVSLSQPSGKATILDPATATITIVDDDSPELAGQWSALMDWPTVPIHMHLTPSGQVIFWDRHSEAFGWDGDPRL